MNPKKFRKQHPFLILDCMSRYLLFLLFPLIRSLSLLGGDFAGWWRGFWMDLLAVALILILGLIYWFCYLYCAKEQEILIRKGVLLASRLGIRYRDLATFSLERPWFLRPFRVVRVKMDTDAGSWKKADVALLLNQKEAQRLAKLVGKELQGEKKPARSYRTKALYVALLSFLTSNTLSGVLFASTLISQSGRLFGEEAQRLFFDTLTNLAQTIVFWLPPAAAILAFILLGGWTIAFLLNLIRHLRFRVFRKGQSLTIDAGLFTLKETELSVSRINYLLMRQSFLTKLFGFYSVFLNCSGYGKGSDELSALFPALDERELNRSLRFFLPEYRWKRRKIRPVKRAFTRFIIPPLSWLLAVVGVFFLFYPLMNHFRTLWFFLLMMASLPLIWWLFVKITAFFHSGAGVKGNLCTFSCTFGFRIYTLLIRKERIAKVEVRASFFQRMIHCCDLIIIPYSEQPHRFVVQNLSEAETERFLAQIGLSSGEEETKRPRF